MLFSTSFLPYFCVCRSCFLFSLFLKIGGRGLGDLSSLPNVFPYGLPIRSPRPNTRPKKFHDERTDYISVGCHPMGREAPVTFHRRYVPIPHLPPWPDPNSLPFTSPILLCVSQSHALLTGTFCTHNQTRKDSKCTTARGDAPIFRAVYIPLVSCTCASVNPLVFDLFLPDFYLE